MTQPCDCCEGPLVSTPATTANRPGLSALSYRVGTHPTFLQTMQARLSSRDFPALERLRTREGSDPSLAMLDAFATVADVLTFYQERIANEGYLRTATERRSVLELARLIGYAPRPGVAASAYLAYTLEKDAAPVEIPKGALASSVPAPGEQMQGFETSEPLQAHVAFNAMKPRMTHAQTFADVLAIERDGLYLKGTATRLKPNDPLVVKVARDARPQLVYVEQVIADPANDRTRVTLLRTSQRQLAIDAVAAIVDQFMRVEDFDVSPDSAMTKRVTDELKLVLQAAAKGPMDLVAALKVALDHLNVEATEASEKHYTKLLPWIEKLMAELAAIQGLVGAALGPAVTVVGTGGQGGKEFTAFSALADQLKRRPSIPPASARQLPRSADATLAPRSDAVPRLLAAMQPALTGTLYATLRNLPPQAAPQLEVHALRVVAAPFGHNAPLRLDGLGDNKLPLMAEWNIFDPLNQNGDNAGGEHHEPFVIFLDNDYEIAYPQGSSRSNSFVVIDRPGKTKDGVESLIATLPRRTLLVELDSPPVHRSLTAYGLSGKTVRIKLPEKPVDPNNPLSVEAHGWIAGKKEAEPFGVVRGTRVFAGSEQLALAEAPIADAVAGCELEFAELHRGLQPGRWMIVAGERADIDIGGVKVPGVMAAELVMIESVEHRSAAADRIRRPGDKLHTFVSFASCLAYRYQRDSVTVYGNVVGATHGETRREVLGSGDAAKPLQAFTLKQSPLTFVSATTPSGIDSSLEVRVNDVQWHQHDMLAALGPQDRGFLARIADDGKVTVNFGDGQHGVRLPTGVENVKATYRSGIGAGGNVKAGQISLLGARPLGVKEVTNPIRASGGADPETRDQARKNAPLALLALDRLVSSSDYADFSRTFAGIGKAAATRIADGDRQSVRVVIAGARDIPIEPSSALYRNLNAALHRFGDPHLPIELDVRERAALVVSARIKVDPDHQWETLEPRIRSAMLEHFGFERMELGQDALLSDAIRVMQAVRGVVYVDVDVFAAVSEQTLLTSFEQSSAQTLDLRARITVAPDQIVYLAPEVPDTLILQEVQP